jgi:hypothetical protein
MCPSFKVAYGRQGPSLSQTLLSPLSRHGRGSLLSIGGACLGHSDNAAVFRAAARHAPKRLSVP